MDFLDHGVGDIRRQGCWLDNGRNPRKQIGTDFLQHAPNREVIGVDVHGHTAFRDANVVANEGPFPRQHGRVPIHEIGEVRQLLAQTGVGKQGADAALYINPGVRAGRPGMRAPDVELFLVLHQVEREGLEHPSALLKGHPSQVVTSNCSAIGVGRGQIDVGRIQRSHRRAMHGIEKGSGRGACRDPLTGNEVVQYQHVNRKERPCRHEEIMNSSTESFRRGEKSVILVKICFAFSSL